MTLIRRVYEIATLLLGVVSLLALIDNTVNVGFISTLELIILSYESILSFVLGWMDPYIGAAISMLSSVTGLSLTVGEHWRYIFVLLTIYFMADTYVAWAVGKKGIAAINVPWGVLVALVTSLICGAQDISDASVMAVSVVSFGVVTYKLFQVILSSWMYPYANQSFLQNVAYYVKSYVVPDAILSILLIVAIIVARAQGVPVSGILQILVLVVLIALRNIGLALVIALKQREGASEKFKSLASQRIGFRIIQVVVGAGAVVAANAGLKLVGIS